MSNIDWKRKLTSRKLWVSLCGLVTNLIIAFGGSNDTAVQVTAIIMATASCVAFVIGEGLVDAAAIGMDTFIEEPEEEIEDEE